MRFDVSLAAAMAGGRGGGLEVVGLGGLLVAAGHTFLHARLCRVILSVG